MALFDPPQIVINRDQKIALFDPPKFDMSFFLLKKLLKNWKKNRLTPKPGSKIAHTVIKKWHSLTSPDHVIKV